jgi:DNA-binding PadR family transcriptional regulator
MVRYALLGLLREQQDYGYHLKRRFDERVGALWDLNIGQVYQTLRALERSGHVVAVEAAADAESPGRHLYALTPKGERALDRWTQKSAGRPRPIRDETLVRLLLLEPERRGEVLARLEEQEAAYRKQLARLVAQKRRAEGETPDGVPVRQIGLEAALLHTEAHLKWLAACRERLAGPS